MSDDQNEIEITSEIIEQYCMKHSSEPTKTQKELITETRRALPSAARMQVGHLEGKFLTLVASMMNAKHALEFGTFTGYSALSIAEGLGEGGKVTTLDIDPSATEIAKKYWQQCKEGSKIELLLGDAQKTIHQLEEEIASGKRPKFDLAFIDADKAGYKTYWEACFKLVRKGGVILVDNVLWSGRVLNPSDKSDFTIHEFNTMAAQDVRAEKIMLPLRDGILVSIIR